MSGGNNGGFLDRLMKQGKVTPSPSTYNLNVSIIPKSQNIYSLKDKSERLTEAQQIEKEYKKHKFPGPNQYNTNNFSKMSNYRRPIVDPWAKAERIGYLHEIEWKSKNTPGFYEIKRRQVEEKSKSYSFR